MPLYCQQCEKCGKVVRRVCRLQELDGSCGCGGKMRRIANPPTTTIKEKLDSGAHARAVERYSDIEQVMKNIDPVKDDETLV